MVFPPQKIWFSAYRPNDKEKHVSWRFDITCDKKQADHVKWFVGKVNTYNVLNWTKGVNIDANITNFRIEKKMLWHAKGIVVFNHPRSGFMTRTLLRAEIWPQFSKETGIYDLRVYSSVPIKRVYTPYRNPFKKWHRMSYGERLALAAASANPGYGGFTGGIYHAGRLVRRNRPNPHPWPIFFTDQE